MTRLPFLLALALASATSALPVSTTFYTRTGATPACGQHRSTWTQLAISRDLLPLYPCGTRLRLTLARAVGGRRVVTGVVSDVTGPRARRTVDVLVGSRGEALRYGRVAAELRRVR